MNEEIYKKLPDALLSWYKANKRTLPWRNDKEPYHIWLSEVMLQQTRVEAVKGYYTRFLNALPTMEALANAEDGQLHKLWEGLGYYSRVRNLKKAARVIVDEYGGKFPEDYDKVIALPGIGEYTAGAICSIAYDIPVPAVDGNVLRVLTRLTNDRTPVNDPKLKAKIRDGLSNVYPMQAGEFTQALMELGATVCGPNRKPDCESCPCCAFCQGYASGDSAGLPVRAPKRPRKTEEKTVLILSCEGYYALEQRPAKGLLAGLWQFPNVPGKLDVKAALSKVEDMGLHPKEILRQVEKKHIFTHIQWDMIGVYVEVRDKSGAFLWFSESEIRESAALPTAFRQFWEETE